nr:hypothetical protein [Nocardioides sp. TRM66260-LWL]
MRGDARRGVGQARSLGRAAYGVDHRAVVLVEVLGNHRQGQTDLACGGHGHRPGVADRSAAFGAADRLRSGAEHRGGSVDRQLAHRGGAGRGGSGCALVDLDGQHRHQGPQLLGVERCDQLGDLVVLAVAGRIEDEARQLAAALVEVHDAPLAYRAGDPTLGAA